LYLQSVTLVGYLINLPNATDISVRFGLVWFYHLEKMKNGFTNRRAKKEGGLPKGD
jgi:hypothetical protein